MHDGIDETGHVSHACMDAVGGCSLTWFDGITQLTCGSVPFCKSVVKTDVSTRRFHWSGLSETEGKCGSGFQWPKIWGARGVVIAVRLAGRFAGADIVFPVDSRVRQQVYDSGKAERFGLSDAGLADPAAALRRQHINVGRQAIGSDRIEETILQRVELRVRPVVRNLTVIMPAHHVSRILDRAVRIVYLPCRRLWRNRRSALMRNPSILPPSMHPTELT